MTPVEVLDIFAEDDILTLIEKLKWAKTNPAALRLTDDEAHLREVDWLLLRRECEALGKKVYVLCEDPLLAELPRRAGLGVYTAEEANQPDFLPWRKQRVAGLPEKKDGKTRGAELRASAEKVQRQTNAQVPLWIWLLLVLGIAVVIYAGPWVRSLVTALQAFPAIGQDAFGWLFSGLLLGGWA